MNRVTTQCFTKSLCAAAFVSLLVSCAGAENQAVDYQDIPASTFDIDIVVAGLNHPWGMAILPEPYTDLAIITERSGSIKLINLETAAKQTIMGTPSVVTGGQAGLLDVLVHQDDDGLWIYLTWSGANPNNAAESATYTGRARLDHIELRLIDLEILHIATPWSSQKAHYGSRLVIGSDGYLYITQGDRRQPDAAQDLSSYWGKTLRIALNGSIPRDNPFVHDPNANDAIFTYGHRNAQSMAVEPQTGLIWQGEHGERNGDEINVIDQPGANYGWPIATYGRHYVFRTPIGDLPTDRDDTVNPIYFWTTDNYTDEVQGFPPSGMAFYEGTAFAQWQGDLLMGNLRHQYLGRFERNGQQITFEHRLLRGEGWRVRDVKVHPVSGYIYLLVDAADAPLVRVKPKN